MAIARLKDLARRWRQQDGLAGLDLDELCDGVLAMPDFDRIVEANAEAGLALDAMVERLQGELADERRQKDSLSRRVDELERELHKPREGVAIKASDVVDQGTPAPED